VIIDSSNFPKWSVSAIGRYEFACFGSFSGFGIGTTIACLKDWGILPEFQILLKKLTMVS